MITDEDRERVRAATDLVALVQETVELKPRGREFWCCCPFHGEKTPSFHIIPANQSWHCFGCGEGGDAFSYIMKRENLSFPDAIRYLADRAGIELHETGATPQTSTKRARIIAVCEETSQFFHTLLMRGHDDTGRVYCTQRGLTFDVCKRYRLGYAYGHGTLTAHLTQKGFSAREMLDANVVISRGGNKLQDRFYERVMFPIFDEQGRCIAFGGRITGAGEPKYLNTAETPAFHKKKNLYGFNWAKEHIVAKNEAVVVEGYTDALACWEAGIGNVVATLGTALTEHHVKTLTRFAKRIVYLFDGDAAGQKAAERAIQFIEGTDVDLRCVILPDNQDPNDFVRACGGEALRERIDAAIPLMDFVFGKLGERSDTSTPGGRAKALDDALHLIYPIRSSYMIDSYYVQIADRLGIDSSVVRDAAPRVFRDIARAEARVRERVTYPEATNASLQAKSQSEPVGTETEPDTATPAPLPPVLSDLERRALACERELLTLLTIYPDDFRGYAERVTQIDWVDARSESIAWAVLATPENTGSAAAMDAARAVCPEAAELVSVGTLSSTSTHPTEENIAFLLDTLELYTVQRRMRATQAKLRSNSTLDASERRKLTIQATKDSARVRELGKRLEGITDPFRDDIK